jgi:hypothetical protein
MARRANRGRGGKKNSNLSVKRVLVDLDASRFLDCEADLSIEEVNCEALAAEDMPSSQLVGQVGSIEGYSRFGETF